MKKEKKYYEVRVECLVPTTVSYRVLAEDEKEALKLLDQNQAGAPVSVNYKINLKRKIKLVIYDWGTTIIKMVKNF